MHLCSRYGKEEQKELDSKSGMKICCCMRMRLYIQIMESLILAQDERWRRASYMQVERGIAKVREQSFMEAVLKWRTGE